MLCWGGLAGNREGWAIACFGTQVTIVDVSKYKSIART